VELLARRKVPDEDIPVEPIGGGESSIGRKRHGLQPMSMANDLEPRKLLSSVGIPDMNFLVRMSGDHFFAVGRKIEMAELSVGCVHFPPLLAGSNVPEVDAVRPIELARASSLLVDQSCGQGLAVRREGQAGHVRFVDLEALAFFASDRIE